MQNPFGIISSIIVLSLVWVILAGCDGKSASESSEGVRDCHDRALLQRELESIRKADQKYRVAAMEMRKQHKGVRTKEEAVLWEKQETLDSLNFVIIEDIIAHCGYPGKSRVGEELKSVFVFVFLHNPLKSEKFLDVLWAAAKEGNIEKREVALLQDRILMLKGEDQIFGTAMKYDTVGVQTGTGEVLTAVRIWPVKDFSDLDKRREEVGWYSFRKQCELEGIDPAQFNEYQYQQNHYDF